MTVNEALGNPAEAAAAAASPVAAADFDPPLWQQDIRYPSQKDRTLIESIWPLPGTLGGGDLAVGPRTAGPNMSVDVAAGLVVIAGTDMAAQGSYLCRLRNTVNVTVGPAPAAGLTRRDLIVARVYDDAVDGGGRNEWAAEAVAGTAVSTNPQPAPLPTSAVALAEVTVDSGTAAISAAMIADRRNWLNRPPATFVQSGTSVATVNPDGGMNRTLYPVPFKAGTFPIVVIMSGDLTNWKGYAALYFPGSDHAGFQFNPYENNVLIPNRTIRYNWIAHGQTA